MRHRSHCEICGASELRVKETIKLNGIRICKKCYREDKKGRAKLRGQIKIAGKYADRNFRPELTKKKENHSKNNLTWEEKKILYNQFVKNGMDEDIAKIRVKSLSNYEKNLFKKLNEEGNLNKRFKKEFNKLIK